MGRLTGKFAIVTGGGSGIGRAICQVFAKEGASVAVIDINKDGIEETLSLMQVADDAKHCSIVADITSSEQVENAFKNLGQEIGAKKPILVNNAGVLRAGEFDEISENDFDFVIKTNLKGVFLMTKFFLKALNKDHDGDGERGVIVNMSSINGKSPVAGYASYNASKSGVQGLTKTLALEYPKHRVRCNAVLPGMIYTPMTQDIDKQVADKFIQGIPMKRMGQLEEVAYACLFLASDESLYINGACLDVAGGFGL